jgi:hypothetical protein
MNPINFFKFLEKEKGVRIPLMVKSHLGMPLTPEDLYVKGDLYLSESEFVSFPEGLQVEGSLFLEGQLEISLPKGLKVGEDLDLSGSYIKFLPQGLHVGRDLFLIDTFNLKSLPSDLKVEGDLWVEKSGLGSEERIKSMLTTGYIKGAIFLGFH